MLMSKNNYGLRFAIFLLILFTGHHSYSSGIFQDSSVPLTITDYGAKEVIDIIKLAECVNDEASLNNRRKNNALNCYSPYINPVQLHILFQPLIISCQLNWGNFKVPKQQQGYGMLYRYTLF